MSDFLFTARRNGERPFQKWVTASEALRMLNPYAKEGWQVTVGYLAPGQSNLVDVSPDELRGFAHRARTRLPLEA